MKIVCLDLEGVLVPEIWIAFAEESGIPMVTVRPKGSSYDDISKISSIPHWDDYKNNVSEAIFAARDSFLQGKDVLREWRDNTTEEYVSYYDEAIKNVGRFFEEVWIVE